jgi:hypothetical protein
MLNENSGIDIQSTLPPAKSLLFPLIDRLNFAETFK